MSNFLCDGDASPENDDQPANSVVVGQTRDGKSTLMMTFFNPF